MTLTDVFNIWYCFAIRLLACCICMRCWSPSSTASLMRKSTLNLTHVRSTWTAQGKSDLKHILLDHNSIVILGPGNRVGLLQLTRGDLWVVRSGVLFANYVLKWKSCHRRLPTSFTLHPWEKDMNVRNEKKVKWESLLLGNCHEPPEISISDMGGDPGSNVLHVCSSSNLLSYLVPLNYLSLCV